MSADADFLRAMHIQPDVLPEPAEIPDLPQPYNHNVMVSFEGDEATLSRKDLARLMRATDYWTAEAGYEHGRAERYRRMSIGLMVLCAAVFLMGCVGVWFAN